MSNRKNIIIMGTSESGKTNYLAAALQYFSVCAGEKNPKEIRVKANNIEMANFFALTTNLFQNGIFHKKTLDFNNFELDVKFPKWLWFRHLALIFTDYSGEIFEILNKKEDAISIDESKTVAEIKEKLQTCHAIMLMLDGSRILDGNYLHEVDKYLAPLTTELNKRKNAFSFAFIITKCDELPQKWTNNNGEKLLEKIRKEHFSNLFNVLEWKKGLFSRNNTYRLFCVSCLPNKEVRNTTTKHGVKPNAEWKPSVMKDQVDPLYFLFEKI